MRSHLKIFLSGLCLFASVFASAQSSVDMVVLDSLRVVEDPDGFTNLRAKPSTDAKIVGKVTSGTVIAIDPESKGSWAEIMEETYDAPKRYIHSSRLRRVDTWKKAEIGNWEQQKSASLLMDGVKVQVTSVPFVAKEHKITKDKDGLIQVDGRYPWGRDGDTPSTSMTLEVTAGDTTVQLPAEATRHLFEPNVGSLALLTPSTASKHLIVYMGNGDGAGAYCVAWAFKDGVYLGRVVFSPY